jgi:hypothetical protein
MASRLPFGGGDRSSLLFISNASVDKPLVMGYISNITRSDLAPVQVLCDSRTEGNTDSNSFILFCPCSFPSVSRKFGRGLAALNGYPIRFALYARILPDPRVGII